MARARTRTWYYALEGGLDVVSPPSSIKAGRAITMFNFEPWYEGGYRRIPGYERTDGRPRPSDATYVGFDTTDFGALAIGATVTGDTSGATGIVVGKTDFATDEYYAIGVSKVTGTFQNGETCNTADFTILSAPTLLYEAYAAPENFYGLQDANYKSIWKAAAANLYRADIAVVPGSGRVRGAWRRGADQFAIRNNAGATAGILHLASSSGWVTTGITLAYYLFFDTGLAAGANLAEGDTIEGTTSGETAVVHRIVLNGGSGAWDGTGEGYVILTSPSGAFTSGEDFELATVPIFSAVGTPTQFSFPVNGRYQFLNHNFYGGADTLRVYGVNGEGPAFEIDENNVVSPILLPSNPIADSGTPPPANEPFMIEEHRGHLFLAFEGGSFIHSIPGEPLNLSGFLGAAEFGMGDEITGMNSVVGNVLVVKTRRTTKGLYGTDVTNWELRRIAEQSGAIAYSSQKIDTVYSVDDLGITSLARTDQFGDFVTATISQQIQPIINGRRSTFVDSTIVRESNQYRSYYSDGSCIVAYVLAGSEQARFSSRYNYAQYGMLLYDDPIASIYNTEDETGKERTYFVTSNAANQGFVYEDRIGTSFDGADIVSFIRTAYTDLKAPRIRKKYRRADIEMTSESQMPVIFVHDPTYGSEEITSSITDLDYTLDKEIPIREGNDVWDIAAFQWGGEIMASTRMDLSGSGENISFIFATAADFIEPFVIQGITVHYDLRRLQR